MVRGENICSGTSTTGAGTLTLAACPAAVGGIDHDVFLKAKGFVSGNAVPTSYTIIEYTDNTFATTSKVEKGVGRVTLGASITAATLTRDTIQETITGGAYSDQAPSAISIGTAANVLVFIGASAADLLANNPYFDNAVGDAIGIAATPKIGGATFGLSTDGSGTDWHWRFYLTKSLYVRRATLRVAIGYSGTTGTPVSTAYGRIYYVNSSGRPAKLAIDLGTFGSNPLNTIGNVSTGLASPGIFLTPGEYFFNLFATFTGATGTVTTPAIAASNTPNISYQFSAGSPITHTIATGGSSTASDPANTTGYAAGGGGTANIMCVWLKDS